LFMPAIEMVVWPSNSLAIAIDIFGLLSIVIACQRQCWLTSVLSSVVSLILFCVNQVPIRIIIGS